MQLVFVLRKMLRAVSLTLALGAAVAVATSNNNVADDPTCGYAYCPKGIDGMLNVHIVPHTHLDGGWIKTVDEYYYGAKKGLANGAVQMTYDTVIDELLKNKDRRFVMCETDYFWRWWRELDDPTRHSVQNLVNAGQLEFIGGGWVQNDEANSYYSAIIDQMEYGLRLLNDTFGACAIPKIGWQIDPFGHSKEQASLFAQMGFDGFFFARADYQDIDKRRQEKTAALVWDGDEELGDAGSIFTELLPEGYGPPGGFCWDVYCNDDPIMDDHRLKGYNVDQRVDDFIKAVTHDATYGDTNNVIATMGSDFNYVSAHWWYKNLDKLIMYTNARQANGSKVNLMYSTPACYVKAQNAINKKWTTKQDDFFPYASDPHAYWTGYFTSRTALKHYMRTSDAFLKVCKQLDIIAQLDPLDKQNDIEILRDAVSLAQHHDAITGTSKQLVAYDYALRLSEGVAECEGIIDTGLQKLIAADSKVAAPKQLFCQLLNISQCAVTENSPNVAITVWNPLSRGTWSYVRIPVTDGAFTVVQGIEKTPIDSQLVPVSAVTKAIPGRDSKATQELVFKVTLPPVGYQVYFISKTQQDANGASSPSEVSTLSNLNDDPKFENAYLSLVFDQSTGIIKQMTDKVSGVQIPLKQTIGFYTSALGDNNKFETRSSGAYIFRPNCTGQPDDGASCVRTAALNNNIEVVKGLLVNEIRQSNDWLSLVTRLYQDSPEVEFEWTVGAIPFADGVGKEVVVRFDTGLASAGKFYTDTSGRQLLQRTRNFRPTWNLNVTEPVSGNYYPVQAFLGISDSKTTFGVLAERAYGGSSLADGQVEIMVHRRCLHDDAFGVDEALNETGIDGRGLVARGILHVSLVADEKAAPLRLRSQELYSPPALSFSPEVTTASWIAQQPTTRPGLQQSLPLQINLLTVQQWRAGMVLVRLEHMFKSSEDPVLGQPATVDLRALLANLTVVSAQEMTLGANQPVEALKNRFQWQTGKDEIARIQNANVRMRRAILPTETESLEKRGGEIIGDDLVITIKPMEIRTFQLQLQN